MKFVFFTVIDQCGFSVHRIITVLSILYSDLYPLTGNPPISSTQNEIVLEINRNDQVLSVYTSVKLTRSRKIIIKPNYNLLPAFLFYEYTYVYIYI